ncbi:Oxaloacetate decarboxylase gamma chain [Marinobacterium lacunae]|uniref:Probable oxaloacetate decarboxylase gamma chain n=1 Tax=Marinobacterium lacunae TaxID=1232683 RepID=A0A081G0N7_9GAMM|nr:OadG family protein [Marinobacterium lacunae]KEA64342.1 Oxaloacetate decarboxylase gamma chain [Marinobacterium lacunae]MBR9883023.1 OadG family protein [Oceanospirillales bacterium]
MDNLLSEGLNLMVFGMGFVFVFLTLLVFSTGVMSKLVNKYAPASEPKPQRSKSNPKVQSAGAGAKNDELIAVMTAAVHKYRS